MILVLAYMSPPTSPRSTNTARSTNKNPKCDAPDAKRIIIVDDHPLFRKGLQELIHSDDSFAVCGEAGSASEAMEVIRKPDGKLGTKILGTISQVKDPCKELKIGRCGTP